MYVVYLHYRREALYVTSLEAIVNASDLSECDEVGHTLLGFSPEKIRI